MSTIRVISTGLPSWLQREMMRFCSSAMTCRQANRQAGGRGQISQCGGLKGELACVCTQEEDTQPG